MKISSISIFSVIYAAINILRFLIICRLIKINLDNDNYTDTVIPIKFSFNIKETTIVAIDYDPVDKMVYWSDLRVGINRANFQSKSKQEQILIQDVNHTDGIAVDYQGRNIFWTDTGKNHIEVARLDGSFHKILISDDLDEPRDIALDLVNGYMYWSDWGESARIEQAWMDGTHREVIVKGKKMLLF